MSFYIIDNQKVSLTPDEHKIYEDIVKSYSINGFNGEDLFCDLIETDEQGIIVFLKPPSKRQTSFEVFLFLMSVMQNQHIRAMYDRIDDCCAQLKQKMQELDELKLTLEAKK